MKLGIFTIETKVLIPWVLVVLLSSVGIGAAVSVASYEPPPVNQTVCQAPQEPIVPSCPAPIVCQEKICPEQKVCDKCQVVTKGKAREYIDLHTSLDFKGHIIKLVGVNMEAESLYISYDDIPFRFERNDTVKVGDKVYIEVTNYYVVNIPKEDAGANIKVWEV